MRTVSDAFEAIAFYLGQRNKDVAEHLMIWRTTKYKILIPFPGP
jgi:hypothetical protein